MMARHASKVRRTVMRFLPSSVNALFGFHEIASLAVAIETFSAAARRARARFPAQCGCPPLVAQPFDETAQSTSGRNPPTVPLLASFPRCPLLSRPLARALDGGL